MLFGIHQDDAVLVEQPVVALDHDVELAAVPEREPGAAISEHIGVARARGVERRAHALTDRLVPGAVILLDLDAGRLPQCELGRMGARTVAARDESRLLGLDGFQRRLDVLALHAGRIAFWAD